MKCSSGGSGPICFHPRRAERANDESRAAHRWEVNIDTTPARKMTGPRSSCVVRGEQPDGVHGSAVKINVVWSPKAAAATLRQGDGGDGAAPAVQSR